jgi:hypothetical protein
MGDRPAAPTTDPMSFDDLLPTLVTSGRG